MNVASLSLCKELYKVSKWLDTPNCYFNSDSGSHGLTDSNNGELGHDIYREAPAYDLGFLIRKLPPYTRIQTMKGDVPYRVSYDNGVSERGVNANTPEDAAAKLAIELFKQDILKAEV